MNAGGVSTSICQTTNPLYAVVAEFVIMPRHHCSGLKLPIKTYSDVGGKIKVTAVESVGPVADTWNVPIGAGSHEMDLPLINREDDLTTIRVEMLQDGGGYCSLESISCVDADLSAVP